MDSELEREVFSELKRWAKWSEELDGCDMSDAGHTEEPDPDIIGRFERAIVAGKYMQPVKFLQDVKF